MSYGNKKQNLSVVTFTCRSLPPLKKGGAESAESWTPHRRGEAWSPVNACGSLQLVGHVECWMLPMFLKDLQPFLSATCFVFCQEHLADLA